MYNIGQAVHAQCACKSTVPASNPPVADGVIGVCSCPVNSSQIVFWMRSFSPSELDAGFLSKEWCARVYHGLEMLAWLSS